LKLFAGLRKIREFERLRLPFLNSLLDFDIVIEIGYAEEEKRPLTPKQLFLLELGSLTTVRRRLSRLVEQGVITRRTNLKDRRSTSLAISAPSLKLLGKYCKMLNTISAVIC
jgi:DNA-binding MarR family transcriptional regulator